jgi:hypothetical protein
MLFEAAQDFAWVCLAGHTAGILVFSRGSAGTNASLIDLGASISNSQRRRGGNMTVSHTPNSSAGRKRADRLKIASKADSDHIET